MSGEHVGWLIIPDPAMGRSSTVKTKHEALRKRIKGLSGSDIIRARIESEGMIVHNVSPKQINQYPYVFCSAYSMYGYYSLLCSLKDISVTSRLIVGGAGVINISLLKGKAWCAVLGRCDFPISEIMQGSARSNVVYLPKWEGEEVSIGQPQACYAEQGESGVGCQRKCYFCEYGYKYKYFTNQKGSKYEQGLGFEDFFSHLEFSPLRRRYSAGLDGLTEKERWCVNKNISHKEFVSKLIETDRIKNHAVLKLFCVTAFPVLKDDPISTQELEQAFKEAGQIKEYSLTVVISCSHFIPMPLTPMENERVVICKRLKIAPVNTGNIKYQTYLQGIGYSTSILLTAMNRAQGDEIKAFNKYLLHPRFINLPSHDKKLVIDSKLPKIYLEREDILPWLRRTFDLKGAKKEYGERKNACSS